LRIWFLTQFYTPEIGAAAVRLSRLANALAADAHQVTVLTSVPNYSAGVIPPEYRGRLAIREKIGAVDIQRVWVYATPSRSNAARILNQLTFMFMAALAGIFLPRPDVIIVESHPLFVCLTAGWLKRIKRAPLVLNVSDLWPESAVATGALRAGSLIVRMAQLVERWAYQDASVIVGMTEGVVEGINRVDHRPDRVKFIPNAVDLDRFRPGLEAERRSMRQQWGLADPFTVLHVGNLSLTYDFDLILDVAAALPQFAFVFVGGGSQGESVKERVRRENLSNVILVDAMPHAVMPGVWAAADACIIALRDHSVAGGTRPAKLYEALATGTPVVAAIRGEGQALVEASGAGMVVPIGDRAAAISSLVCYAENPELRRKASRKGRAYAEQYFSPERARLAWTAVLEQARRRPSSAESR